MTHVEWLDKQQYDRTHGNYELPITTIMNILNDWKYMYKLNGPEWDERFEKLKEMMK